MPPPVTRGLCSQPAASTPRKQPSPSVCTTLPGSRFCPAHCSTTFLRKPSTTLSFARTGWPPSLSQTKNGISALQLGRQLGVNDNTAWLLKHKLMQAMRERDRAYRLGGTVQVDDAYLGGEDPGGKRGRGSENKTPMLVAVQVSRYMARNQVVRGSLVAWKRVPASSEIWRLQRLHWKVVRRVESRQKRAEPQRVQERPSGQRAWNRACSHCGSVP